MPKLINGQIRANIDAVLNDLHETFSKQITVYKNAERICLASSPYYNNLYGNAGATQSIEYEEVSQTFNARIYFAAANNDEFFSDAQGANNKIILPQGSVKIVVDFEAFQFLKEARIVEFEGIEYSIKSSGGHANSTGMFDTTYYAFILTPQNS